MSKDYAITALTEAVERLALRVKNDALTNTDLSIVSNAAHNLAAASAIIAERKTR